MKFPVPVEIFFVLKVIGFFLHILFMTVWVVGIPVSIALYKYKRKVSERLFKVMPFVMAFGLNAGVVPLLFIQTIYPKFFYTATILQGWFWFLIIPLLIIAYYAVYLAYYNKYPILCSLIAFVLLTGIGLIFSSVMSSFTKSPQWFENIFLATTGNGAVYGSYLNLSAEALWRYVLIAGMGFGTLVSLLGVDKEFFSKDEEYNKQIRDIIPVLCIVGVLLYAVGGITYRDFIFGKLHTLWFILTGASVIIYLLLTFFYIKSPSKKMVLLVLMSHIMVLATNVISRQIVQFNQIKQWFDISNIPVVNEWGGFYLFAITFVLGIGVLIWIAKRLMKICYKNEIYNFPLNR